VNNGSHGSVSALNFWTASSDSHGQLRHSLRRNNCWRGWRSAGCHLLEPLLDAGLGVMNDQACIPSTTKSVTEKWKIVTEDGVHESWVPRG